jgi:dihydropteroate synthase
VDSPILRQLPHDRAEPPARLGVEPRAHLGAVTVGGQAPVAVMGVLNVSPESFYPGSVYAGDALVHAAEAMVDAGAALLDIGAMSTAPYLDARINADEECRRLAEAVAAVAPRVGVPVSVDTASVRAASVALDAGAAIVNDVTGLADPALAALVASRRASVVVMASPAAASAAGIAVSPESDPIVVVQHALATALARARDAGIPDDAVVLDPGIGFFLAGPGERARWDVAVLAQLAALATLERPLLVGVSRKSFLGVLTGRTLAAERLSASLAATALAVRHGAAVIRAHDVAETIDAVRVAEAIAHAGCPP